MPGACGTSTAERVVYQHSPPLLFKRSCPATSCESAQAHTGTYGFNAPVLCPVDRGNWLCGLIFHPISQSSQLLQDHIKVLPIHDDEGKAIAVSLHDG